MAAEKFSTDAALENLSRPGQTFPFNFNFGGFDFVCCENVFLACDGFEKGIEALHNLPLPKARDNAVLEIGCGTGCLITSLYLKNKAAISQLLAVDISPYAVENTRLNFDKYNINGNTRTSDVFSSVRDDDRFDLIFWNIPFSKAPTHDRELSIIEMTFIDPGYAAFGRYMRDVSKHLTQEGRVFFYFSADIGDMDALDTIAKTHGKQVKVVMKKKFVDFSGVTVYLELYEAVDII